jgi:hypothetical protein
MQKIQPRATAYRFLFLLFIFFITIYFTAKAQVTPVGTPASASQNNTIASFTVPAGNKRLLLVTASDGASTNITGVKFNGVSMVERKEVTDASIAVDAIYTLSLGDAAVPVTGSIIFTSTGPNNTARFVSAAAFTKVDQTTPLSDMKGDLANTSSSTVTVASATGDLVYDIFDSWNSTLSGTQVAGSGQTIVNSSGGLNFGGSGAGYGFYSTSKKAGAASVTTSWVATGHQAEIHIAVNIKQDNIVLPVNLVSFIATGKNEDVVLNWRTTGAVDLDHTEIERSSNGIDFSLAAIPATATGEYTDVNVARLLTSNGNLFYRLKMIGQQGDFSYSPVVMVKVNKRSSFVTGIQPLFASGKIAVSLNMPRGGMVTLQLSNLTGQLIKTMQVNVATGNNIQYMNGLNALPAGVYALQVSYGRESVTQKLTR